MENDSVDLLTKPLIKPMRLAMHHVVFLLHDAKEAYQQILITKMAWLKHHKSTL